MFLWWMVGFSISYIYAFFNLKVLIISFVFVDVSSNRKMLRALLHRNGVKQVDLAENGLEAVQAALADPMKYDVIFMDNFMPVMVLLVKAIMIRCIRYESFDDYE